MIKSGFLLSSLLVAKISHTCVSIQCTTYYVRTLSQADIDTVFANNVFISQKHGSLSSFRPSQEGPCTDIFKNLSVNSLKRDLSNDAIFSPPVLFFHWSIPLSKQMLIIEVYQGHSLLHVKTVTVQCTLKSVQQYTVCTSNLYIQQYLVI